MAIKYIRMTFFESADMNAFSKTVIRLMEEILHQLIGSLSHYLQGFIHSRWCRISSINSMYCGPLIFSVLAAFGSKASVTLSLKPIPLCANKCPNPRWKIQKKNDWTKVQKRSSNERFAFYIDRLICVFDGLIFEKKCKNYFINTV